MTETEARTVLENILLRLGIKSGDCLMLGVDMGKLPLPAYPAALNRQAFREREQKWCEFVLDVLLDCVGPNGTIFVPSYTYSCGRPGSVFVAEKTSSENGPFTEYVRTRPEAIRSLHPIFSLSGIGRDAASILKETGRSAFGAMSPFGRFANHGVKFACLGVELRNSITYIHHQEQSYGCPHRYNKTFYTTVIAEGQALPGEWYASVGYRSLGYISDISSLQNSLDDLGMLVHANWHTCINQLAEIADVDLVGYDLLSKDFGAFINRRLRFQFEESDAAKMGNSDSTMLTINAIEQGK